MGTQEEETLETPNPDLLDPIFQKGEDGWLTVTDKRKKTKKTQKAAASQDVSPEESTQKKKRKRKPKRRKPSMRVLAEEDDAKDQVRARYDMKKGDPLEVYSSFDSAWLKATVESAFQDQLTIQYYSLGDSENIRTGKFVRFSDDIRPIK